MGGCVPVAYYDLFRVVDVKIVEHWDLIALIPKNLPHAHGFI
jgi:predicted SnoaL-like aldol condensation-catalyzing enzyme